jgi:hypothetical protein
MRVRFLLNIARSKADRAPFDEIGRMRVKNVTRRVVKKKLKLSL